MHPKNGNLPQVKRLVGYDLLLPCSVGLDICSTYSSRRKGVIEPPTTGSRLVGCRTVCLRDIFDNLFKMDCSTIGWCCFDFDVNLNVRLKPCFQPKEEDGLTPKIT